MKSLTFTLSLLMANLLMSSAAQAHHSFAAEFDANQETELEGVVIKVEWTNPHTYLYIEMENDDGDYEEWALELGSPNGLTRRGWTRDTLAVGDVIRVRGTLARDGSNKINAQVVVIADTCERLFAGTSQRDFNEPEGDANECKL